MGNSRKYSSSIHSVNNRRRLRAKTGRAEWNSEWRMEMDGGDTQSCDTLLQKQKLKEKLKQAEGGKKTGDHLVSESELHITI